MGQASLWFKGSDMLVTYSGLISSTASSTAAGSTEFIASSTGVTLNVWGARTSGSTSDNVVANKNVPYVAGSDGKYQCVVQSTAHSMARGTNGFIDVVVDHSGLDDRRRIPFRVEWRGTT